MSYADKRHGSRGRTTKRTLCGRLPPVRQTCPTCKQGHDGEGCATRCGYEPKATSPTLAAKELRREQRKVGK